jgi:glycosyltransferase 2 family protein
MASRKFKQRVFGMACVCISFALVAQLLGRIDLDRTALILQRADWRWLGAALAVTCCIPFCTVFRWMGVLRAQEDLRLGYWPALRAVLMANVLNSVLPSKAGDGAKAFYLRKQGGLSRGIGTVILERAVDFSILGLLGIGGYLMSGAVWGLWTGVLLLGAMLGLFCCILLLPFHRLPLPPKVLEKLEALLGVFQCWIKKPEAVLQTVAASLCSWSLAGLLVCCLVSALDTDLPWGYAYGVFPLAVLAGLVPVTLSGVGTRDTAFVLLLASQMPAEEATLVGLGYTIFAYWLLSLISLPVVFWEIADFFRSQTR